MEITYDLNYHSMVISEDIPKLNGAWKKKIKTTIEKKLKRDPLLYGKPLRKNLYGYHKLRIGDYRVIYTIKKDQVYIWAIQHRKRVYETNFNNRK